MAVEAMLFSGANHMALNRSWLSSILKPGVGVLIGASPVLWLVLPRNRWGCVVWQLQGQRNGALKFFAPAPFVSGEPAPWRLLHVQGLDGFRIMRLRSLPPVDLKDLNAAELPTRGVVIVPDGQFESLQQFAAREAFRTLGLLGSSVGCWSSGVYVKPMLIL